MTIDSECRPWRPASRVEAAWSVVSCAWLSRVYVATVETPAVEAVAVNRPGTPLATSGGEVATPFESVVALGCRRRGRSRSRRWCRGGSRT